MKKVLFALVAIAFSAMIFADNAVYIYRNDGGFNAFFDADIDSMAYSTVDIDGVDHQRYVTQLIYTADSLYRIPLSAIDSIAFTERPVKYKPEVVKINEDYIPYIVSVDGMSIKFRTTLPDNLSFCKDDILLYEGSSDLFPGGFVGRIKELTATDSVFAAECEDVYVDEVYETLTFVSDYVLESTHEQTAQYSLKTVASKYQDEAAMSLSRYIELSDPDIGSFNANYNGSLNVRAVVNLNPALPFYADLSCTSTHTFSGEMSSHTEKPFFINEDNSIKLFNATLPLPDCPALKLEYVVAPFFKGESRGSATVGIDATSIITNGVLFCEDEDIEIYRKNDGCLSSLELTDMFNIDGTIFGGVVCSAYFGTAGYSMGTQTDLYVGPKISGNQTVDIENLDEGNIYDAVKDAQINVSLGAEMMTKAKVNLLNWSLDRTFDDEVFDMELGQWYIYPLFSAPTYTQGDNKSIALMKTVPSRILINPVEIGMRLKDEHGNATTQYTSSTTYCNSSNGTIEYTEQFERLKPDVDYEVYPMLKAFGMEIQATPSGLVKIEVEVSTGEASGITESEAVVSGYGDCLETADSVKDLGVVYNTTGTPDVDNGTYVSSGHAENGDFDVVLGNLEAETTYYYRTCLNLDGRYYYGDIKTFTTGKDEITPGQEVELGLSVKWAGWNVGASEPEGYGGYYAWGEIEEKDAYYENTYLYYSESDSSGEGEWIDIGENISATEYDVARQKWGDSWRMPTSEEIRELRTECTWTWVRYKGVNGYKVTGPNGNSIFLPAAGGIVGESLCWQGSYGRYWSGTLTEDYVFNAWALYFDETFDIIYPYPIPYDIFGNFRSDGYTVRPVKDK